MSVPVFPYSDSQSVMKIFTSSQISEIEQITIEREHLHTAELMERAAAAFVGVLQAELSASHPIVVFAGPGNNGGDALSIARMLADEGHVVDAYLFNVTGKLSEECAINRQRLRDNRNVRSFTEVSQQFDTPMLTADTLVIDGLFGTGLRKPLSGGFAMLVKYINQSGARVVSVDVPSGLMTEDNTFTVSANVVHADLTITFQFQKLSFLMADNQCYVGQVKVADIGLDADWIASTDTPYRIVEEAEVRSKLLPRDTFAHKGEVGKALIIAGSYGMMGAAVLCAKACLRAGVGKVVAHMPQRGCPIMQTALPEAVVHMDKDENKFTQAVETDGYDAVGIGPGLGQDEQTAIALVSQLRHARGAMLLDADALNILANHQAWMQQLPQELIITPHAGEFDLLNGGPCSSDYERLGRARDMAMRLHLYVLLKGHYSALCLPSGHVLFNSTGNAGMATAGSGDVLTGIITALLARGYNQTDACMVGMYLHGLAGDIAAKEKGQESLIASDIIEYLPAAFRQLSIET